MTAVATQVSDIEIEGGTRLESLDSIGQFLRRQLELRLQQLRQLPERDERPSLLAVLEDELEGEVEEGVFHLRRFLVLEEGLGRNEEDLELGLFIEEEDLVAKEHLVRRKVFVELQSTAIAEEVLALSAQEKSFLEIATTAARIELLYVHYKIWQNNNGSIDFSEPQTQQKRRRVCQKLSHQPGQEDSVRKRLFQELSQENDQGVYLSAESGKRMERRRPSSPSNWL